MSKINRNVTLMTMMFIAGPVIGNDISSEQIEKFAEICDEGFRPEEKITLWFRTGSTTSAEERRCMNLLALKESRNAQNNSYFEQRLADDTFRDLSANSALSSSAVNSESEWTFTEKLRITERNTPTVHSTDILTLPNYKTLK